MTDFFVSYTNADREWAEWIAFVLEEAGFSTIIQAWDFRPGSNFVLEMHRAAESASRTIMVLSPDYLNSKMAASEWASAFALDPQGLERRLVPVMVRSCEPKGLLPTIVQIRVVNLDEDTARTVLLAGVEKARAKPSARPSFPGSMGNVQQKTFPGRSEPSARPGAIPKLRRPWSDLEKKKFLKSGLQEIRHLFQINMEQCEREEPRLASDFTAISEVDFSAEIYLDGKCRCRCRIWLANEIGSEFIAFQEGNTTGNAMNEMLYPSSDDGENFSATLAMGFHGSENKFDMKRLSSKDAAEYLWGRFVYPLSY